MPIILINSPKRETLEERIMILLKDDAKTALQIAKLLNRPVSCINIALNNLKSLKSVGRRENNKYYKLNKNSKNQAGFKSF